MSYYLPVEWSIELLLHEKNCRDAVRDDTNAPNEGHE